MPFPSKSAWLPCKHHWNFGLTLDRSVNEGRVLLDGHNVQSLQLKWLRAQIGLVNQEPALFATSIRDNILFGKEDASFDEIVTAARTSGAHDFINQLPAKYDTQVIRA